MNESNREETKCVLAVLSSFSLKKRLWAGGTVFRSVSMYWMKCAPVVAGVSKKEVAMGAASAAKISSLCPF